MFLSKPLNFGFGAYLRDLLEFAPRIHGSVCYTDRKETKYYDELTANELMHPGIYALYL